MRRFKQLCRNLLFLSCIPVARVIRRMRPARGVWIVGGNNGKLYTDNNALFHQHLLAAGAGIEAYWIINRNSPDRSKIPLSGSVLLKNSLKSFLYALVADVHIYSHGMGDVATVDWGIARRAFKNTLKVLISHGVLGFKKSRHNKEQLDYFTLHIACSELEKSLKHGNWGIDEDRIAVTGYPRFDVLFREKGRTLKDEGGAILYMPTWRDWLVGWKDGPDRDEYLRAMRAFLDDRGLRETLEEKRVGLYFAIHPNMLEAAGRHGYAENGPVRTVRPAENLQEYILGCNMLVTDYSSVAWDFLYQNKPVVFYQFDRDRYLEERGSYLDLREGLFGPTCMEPVSLIRTVETLVSSGFDPGPYRETMREMREKMFRYIDAGNCGRVLQAIHDRVERPWAPEIAQPHQGKAQR